MPLISLSLVEGSEVILQAQYEPDGRIKATIQARSLDRILQRSISNEIDHLLRFADDEGQIWQYQKLFRR